MPDAQIGAPRAKGRTIDALIVKMSGGPQSVQGGLKPTGSAQSAAPTSATALA